MKVARAGHTCSSNQKHQDKVIKELRSQFKLTILLKASNMPKSTYMYWQRNFDRENPDKKLEELIRKIFMDNNQNYGYIRIQIELLQQGFNVNHKKIQRIMKKLNIQCSKFHKPYRKYRSYRGTLGRICDNKINRRFNTPVPQQKLTTDTSEFKYILQSSSGNKVIKKAYLDVFLDMYNGEIISHNLSLKPSSDRNSKSFKCSNRAN